VYNTGGVVVAGSNPAVPTNFPATSQHSSTLLADAAEMLQKANVRQYAWGTHTLHFTITQRFFL
jgi:hypothetical protein